MFMHIDIDSFFISAERTLDSSLRGVPACVGSRSNLEIFSKKRIGIQLMQDNSGAFVTPVFYSKKQRSFRDRFIEKSGGKERIRGIVTTASYEARACGVKTGMALAKALAICPDLRIVASNYPLYHRLSHSLHTYLLERFGLVEQYSIDEFFVDISRGVPKERALAFAKELQEEILHSFGLPVSIGVARSKWIAKLATKDAKPFGVYLVEDIRSYIEDIPIEAFAGIGKGFARRLHANYIFTLGELSRNKELLYSWKQPGVRLYKRVVGSDGEGVAKQSMRKSIGISRTFDPLFDKEELRRRIAVMARHVAFIANEIGLKPTIYCLKIGYEYGVRAKRCVRVDRLFSELLLKEQLDRLFWQIHRPNEAAIKLALGVASCAIQNRRTLSILNLKEDRRRSGIDMLATKIRQKYGLDALKSGSELAGGTLV